MSPGEITNVDIDDDTYGDTMPCPPPECADDVHVTRVRIPLFDDEPLFTE